MKNKNTPIAMSGRVFVDKFLADKLPRFKLGNVRELREGDVKLIAIPKGHGYEGFIRAYVYQDGSGWRNFALRKEASVEAIYRGSVEMESAACKVMMHLRDIVGSTATWGTKFYFVHTIAEKPVATPAAPAQTTTPPPAKPAVIETAATVPLVSNPVVTQAPVTIAKGKRKRKARAEDPNQGRLFD